MNNNFLRAVFFLSFCQAFSVPQVTLIIVIDQFAYHELQKLLPFFKGGIKFLHDNGINYTYAVQPQGTPVTGTGHAVISTGTYAAEHGIISNSWFDAHGKKVICDEDPEMPVIAPHGVYSYGRSAKNLYVDTLSDQIILNSSPHAQCNVLSLSLKSRAAILMAGNLGKALWFDERSGRFTSSKAYYSALPQWLTEFNNKNHLRKNGIMWHLNKKNKSAYNFKLTHNYNYVDGHESLIEHLNPKLFLKTPPANQLLMECATSAFLEWFEKKSLNNHLVMWLSISSLDKVGHLYGPYAQETIDMLYHIDEHLGIFLNTIFEHVDKQELLVALTSDHGVHPIMQLVKKQGLDFARKVNSSRLRAALNKYIEQKFGYKNSIEHIKIPYCYCNPTIKNLPARELTRIKRAIVEQLRKYPGIKNCWLIEDLLSQQFQASSIEYHLQKQYYPGRSGDIIFQIMPYTDMSKIPWGTKHNAPYDYDTHVPLMLYHPSTLPAQTIDERVIIQQLPVTLAHFLQVPRPSASTCDILPGI